MGYTQRFRRRFISAKEKIESNIKHLICFFVAPLYDSSYICFTPSKNWRYSPWIWQFIRQPNGHRPANHYWIIFQKKIFINFTNGKRISDTKN